MYYDLHIHSKLSPCASELMTVNNIINMAKIKGLDVISVTDHNSVAQQQQLMTVAQQVGITYWYGCEVSTSEGAHLLCYFLKADQLTAFQEFLVQHRLPIKNNPEYFGNQRIYDTNDQIVGEEPWLLINELTCSLAQLIDQVHCLNGRCVAAHIYHRSNGIIARLGFIPNNLAIDGVEVVNHGEVKQFQMDYPQFSQLPVLINSDAHDLVDINEAVQTLPATLIERWWNIE